MVSRAGGDRSVVQIIRPGTSGISNALWPNNVRKGVSTGRIAQQRRFLVMKRTWWVARKRLIMPHLRFLYPPLAFVLLAGGIALGVLVFQYWMLLLVLALAWSLIIMLMTRLLCDKIYDTLVTRHRQKQSSMSQKRRMPASSHFPETPMPPTPLIRVLETIDLSRADMESLMADIDVSQASDAEEDESVEESIEEGM